MKRRTRISAGILAVCILLLSFAAFPVIPAAAANGPVIIGYRGDFNHDMTIDIADVRILQAYLLGDSDEITADESECLSYADLDDSNSLNAVDLTLLKRVAMGISPPTPIYAEDFFGDELIPSPINTTGRTSPSVGDVRVLMVAVSFPDAQHEYSAEELQTMCFGPADPQSPIYPVESISGFYTRASYGRLNLTGTVYSYTAQYEVDDYMKTDQRLAEYRTRDDLLDEVLGALDDVIDYNDYDADGNGILDALILALPKGATNRDANGDGSEDWYPCTGTYHGKARFDGVKPVRMCIGALDMTFISKFNRTWIHELGHTMGLPDYYQYLTASNRNDNQGLVGVAGWEMMDDAFGDFCSFSKMMLGWFTGNELQIYTGGTQTYELKSLQNAPSCVLIPRGDLNGFHSEYFMVEFNTHDENNKAGIVGNNGFTLFQYGGVRVMHCNAEMADGNWKWRINGKYYDHSNKKQRILRVITNNNGYFKGGNVINNETKGFAWYDEEGERTIDPGITITVSDFDEDTGCKITIAPA